ncbi:hypothetical protein C1645_820978 [Glomus cerebriforme]|uniref:F-box domain-containing protein n=1 Tax=Glomus cerebriforme TaxID=658196 RepID=A0A397T754_9GLOM|nr:hypothetical protein C1645_820978 [Glomus cerebriforme]
MSRQLLADCLNEIFGYLEEDIFTLHSCLLVNLFGVGFLLGFYGRTCLPKESKDLLYNKKIISTPISKPPLFNYVSFCKVLSLDGIHYMSNFFERIIINFKYESSFSNRLLKNPKNITLTHFPEAKNCLTNLSELTCSSNVDSEFFHQLSQICHNIQSLNIRFKFSYSSGMNVLISSLNNLKYFSLTSIYDYMFNKLNVEEIESSLAKHSNKILRLHLRGVSPLLFINHFENLQELVISFNSYKYFEQI